MTCCCKDCPDRVVGCHSTCGKYIEWSKENEKRKEQMRIEKEQSNPFGTKRPRGFKGKAL